MDGELDWFVTEMVNLFPSASTCEGVQIIERVHPVLPKFTLECRIADEINIAIDCHWYRSALALLQQVML